MLASPLVTPGSPVEAEQVVAGKEAQHSSPEMVAAREESRTEYEGEGPAEAVTLAERAFPDVIDGRGGGMPSLPEGASVSQFLTDDAAQVVLPGGKHGVVESVAPVAVEVSSGRQVPVDLGLVESGGVFEPRTPVVGVHIPRQLQDGVSVVGAGVSLAPVDDAGVPVGGSEGQVDGSVVFYGGIGEGSDVDMAVKPTTFGFSEETFLRSMRSPEALYFQVGMPQGASLVQEQAGSVVRVVDEGVTIGAVAAQGARDATGAPVPVSVSVSGRVLKVSVDISGGEYEYPIEVDPTVVDGQLTDGGDPLWRDSNWREEPAPPSAFEFSEVYGLSLIDHDHGKEYARGEWGAMAYETQGESHIYGLTTETTASNAGGNIENKLFIRSAGQGMEREEVLGSNYAKVKKELCVEVGCAAGTVSSLNDKNAVEFKQTATNTGKEFESELENASVKILQEAGPAISINTSSETVGGRPNMFHAGTWAGPRGRAEVSGSDPGLGVYEFRAQSPNKSGWGDFSTEPQAKCKGMQCAPSASVIGFGAYGENYGAYELPNGEDTVEMIVKDPVGLTATASGKVKVDFSLPYAITLSGLPANKELGDGEAKLKATAKDGSGAFSGSGIESISLKIDGKEVGTASGSCSPGPCTATSGEWAINGAEYAAGQHTATVTAISAAGDVATENFIFDTGHLASPVGLGPGSVSPETGEFSLDATDVSVGGPGAGLSVKRSYGSYHLEAGAEGPLGPQWGISVGGAQSLTKAAEGAVVLTGAEGQESVFTSKGNGEFTSPPLGSSLTLSEVDENGKTKEFLLKDDNGQVTKFTLPSGGTGSTWVPSTLEGPDATNVVTYKFQTVGGITEPTEVLAPVPAGVSCASELVKGCRALGFVYSTKTTATGNGSGEWGEYNGRLKEVTFTAWESASGKMKTTAVAEYVYDQEGRLRGVWNPSVSPALKTTYGYDAAGHVSAISPPGQEPWLLSYGTASGDPRPRIVSITRPSASTAFGNGSLPVNTTVPVVTANPKEGTAASVSTGAWSNTPLSYSYQWERCYPVQETYSCSPVEGATSQTYTPWEEEENEGSEEPHLRVAVTATNAVGSVTVDSTISSYVSYGVVFEEKASFGNEGSGEGQVKEPEAVATEYGESEGVWVVDTGNDRIEKFSPSGTFLVAYGSKGKENGQFEKPVGIAVGKSTVYVADSGNDRVEAFEKSTGKYEGQVSLPGAPAGIALGKVDINNEAEEYLFAPIPSKNDVRYGWFSSGLNKTFGTAGSGNGQFKEPIDVAVSEDEEAKAKGNEIFVTDKGNHRVEIFGPESGINGEIQYVWQFGSAGSGEGQFSSPESLTLEPNNVKKITEEAHGYYGALNSSVFIGDTGNGRVQQSWQSGGSIADWQFGTGQQGLAVASAPAGSKAKNAGDLYIVSASVSSSPRIAKWVPAATKAVAPEPPSPGGSAITTVEYHVPVSGAGAPYAMSAGSVETWGQKDTPVEATAIFPPDEPMGYPAKDYKRATVYYLDSKERLVNVARPGGAISTTEYNSKNDAERTLSADNRATSLKEGCISVSKKECKSLELAEQLDTKTEYNSTGNEELKSIGPRHEVKLSSGNKSEEVQARNVTHYYYDEGAPEGGGEKYGLVTKTTDGALLSNGEEKETLTTITSYGGQAGLGWKLHKPTSVTTDPGGLNLVHTTRYSETTGSVIEINSPEGSHEPLTYSGAFGSYGSGSGQMIEPTDLVTDASGDIWVNDRDNYRIEKYTPKGELLLKFGTEGTAAGQFNKAEGITIDSKGDLWIAESINNRIDEYTPEGVFVKMIGWGVANGEAKLEVCTSSCRAGLQGSGNGEFFYPDGLTINSANDIFIADRGNRRVQELTSEGTFIKSFESALRSEEWEGPYDVALNSSGDLYVTYEKRVVEFSPEGTVLRSWGEYGSGPGQLDAPENIVVGPESNIWLAEYGNSRVQVFTPTGKYKFGFGSYGTGPGQIEHARGIAFYNSNVYVLDSGTYELSGHNNRVETWQMPNTTGSPAAHDTQTIYYSSGTEAPVTACQNHPEWANLVCQTQPTAQPEDTLPELPVTTVAYNMWDEPETTKETVGSSIRTNAATYDQAGRPKTSTITSTVGTALPTITDTYNEKTGALEKQSTTTEGTTKTITSTYNTLGQLTSYTDADENTSTYEYDIDGRVTKTNDGMGTQTYTHDPTTGDLTKLVDSAAGTFTATYDTEGLMLTEGYPNGMSANYTYNSVDAANTLEYVKTTHCTEKCVWFSDSVLPSIHEQWLEQTSTLAHESYAYDNAGRLTQVQNTPTGQGCTTRVYAYDGDTNRTSLTTRGPGSEGQCVTTGGETETHTYDTADRMTDTGIAYNTFGDITTLPATDAGGTELTNTYYVDNQLQSQTQNGETIGYNLDPSKRTRETISTGKTNQDIISHYASPGDTPTWTIETPSGKWKRNVLGIGGGLIAIQNNGETPVLQLTNLHGDIIATASLSETETKLLTTNETSEYGVPATSTPAKYSWLGGLELPTELSSGVIAMGARSYVPQLGRFLQPDPIPGGSANAYTYTFGNPVNTFDPSGALTYGFSPWLKEANNQEAQEVVAREVARETLEREEAERKAREAKEAEERADAPPVTGSPGPEGPLGGSAGWACAYAAETDQEDPECEPTVEWVGATGGNASIASIFSEGYNWVKNHAKKIVASAALGVATVVIGGVTLVATTVCAGSAALSGDADSWFGCYEVAFRGAALTIAAGYLTLKVWNST